MGPIIRLTYIADHTPMFTTWRGNLWIKCGSTRR